MHKWDRKISYPTDLLLYALCRASHQFARWGPVALLHSARRRATPHGPGTRRTAWTPLVLKSTRRNHYGRKRTQQELSQVRGLSDAIVSGGSSFSNCRPRRPTCGRAYECRGPAGDVPRYDRRSHDVGHTAEAY